MQLTGFHHLTAVTANVPENHRFYTQTLGLRLVKKTVNQDDTSSYHLFYADGVGSPGTDITFFDWPATPERRGTRSVSRTGFRVDGESAMDYWQKRLSDLGVTHTPISSVDGRATLDFEDGEGQRLRLVADKTAIDPKPWAKSPVPAEYQIRGLGPITLSAAALAPTHAVVTDVMNMTADRQYEHDGRQVHVYSMGESAGDGGPAAELHVAVEPGFAPARLGAGGVHHVAFRVPTFGEYDLWTARLRELGIQSSGPVDRFYFRSLYFREPGGVLFELATDKPGFAADEPLETLGNHLALPPFLEGKRAQIEAGLKPLAIKENF